MRPLPDYTDNIWFPEHATSYSPVGCFYCEEEVKTVNHTYSWLFTQNENLVSLCDETPILFKLVVPAYSGEDIEPDDESSYKEFDWEKEGWRLSGLVISRFGMSYLEFYQKHGSDDVLQVSLCR